MFNIGFTISAKDSSIANTNNLPVKNISLLSYTVDYTNLVNSLTHNFIGIIEFHNSVMTILICFTIFIF